MRCRSDDELYRDGRKRSYTTKQNKTNETIPLEFSTRHPSIHIEDYDEHSTYFDYDRRKWLIYVHSERVKYSSQEWEKKEKTNRSNDETKGHLMQLPQVHLFAIEDNAWNVSDEFIDDRPKLS